MVNEDVGGAPWKPGHQALGCPFVSQYEAMGVDASGEAWRQMTVDQLRHRLGDDAMVAVVDDPTCSGRLVATGAGVIAVTARSAQSISLGRLCPVGLH